jgi:hypothetical protein
MRELQESAGRSGFYIKRTIDAAADLDEPEATNKRRRRLHQVNGEVLMVKDAVGDVGENVAESFETFLKT